MSGKPILFSGPMINALLDGRKTQTRRVLTPNNLRIWTGGLDFGGRYAKPDATCFSQMMREADGFRFVEGRLTWTAAAFDYQSPASRTMWIGRLPYAPGDLLWVRESFFVERGIINGRAAERACYAASYMEGTLPVKCNPSIHMPRWASRLTLEVTDVRVQRVQKIDGLDAIAEGITRVEGEAPWRTYCHLWNSLNAKPRPRYATGDDGKRRIVAYESFPWSGGEKGDAPRSEPHRGRPHHITPNPWVAAYTFTVQPCNIDRWERAA